MWKTLLRTASWQDIRQLLSPKFLRVFPRAQIVAALGELFDNYRDAEAFDRAVDRRSDTLQQLVLPVRLAPDEPVAGDTKHRHGQMILDLYFHQLFDDSPTLLDLRREQFEAANGTLIWSAR